MDSSIDRVPDEVLGAILSTVGAISPTDLTACLRVNRRWSSVGTGLLYRHLVLPPTGSSLYTFFNTPEPSHAQDVRTLTLHLLPQDGDYTGTIRQLAYIATMLPKLEGLVSFSLRAESFCHLRLPAEGIEEVINALPESCVNLEIDTGGLEQYAYERGQHLCPAIRRVLPRMRNVRLQVSQLCSALFGEHVPVSGGPDCSGKAEWQWVVMPRLETIIIPTVIVSEYELVRLYGGALVRYSTCITDTSQILDFKADGRAVSKTPPMWNTITKALQGVAQAFRAVPADARLLVIGATDDRIVDDGQGGVPFILRSDMASMRTWLYVINRPKPLAVRKLNREWDQRREQRRINRGVKNPDPGSTMIPSYIAQFSSVAEGHIWCTTNNDGRIPGKLFAADGSQFMFECLEPDLAKHIPTAVCDYHYGLMGRPRELWWL